MTEGRAWVTGFGPGLETAPECRHGGEVDLPVWFRDEGDALRYIATEVAKRANRA